MPVRFKNDSEYQRTYQWSKNKPRHESEFHETKGGFVPAGKASTSLGRPEEPAFQKKKKPVVLGRTDTTYLEERQPGFDEYDLLGSNDKFSANVRYKNKLLTSADTDLLTDMHGEQNNNRVIQNVPKKTESIVKSQRLKVSPGVKQSKKVHTIPVKSVEQQRPPPKVTLPWSDRESRVSPPHAPREKAPLLPPPPPVYNGNNFPEHEHKPDAFAKDDNYAHKFKLGITKRPKGIKRQSEYQREFKWKKFVNQSPLISAEQIFHSGRQANEDDELVVNGSDDVRPNKTNNSAAATAPISKSTSAAPSKLHGGRGRPDKPAVVRQSRSEYQTEFKEPPWNHYYKMVGGVAPSQSHRLTASVGEPTTSAGKSKDRGESAISLPGHSKATDRDKSKTKTRHRSKSLSARSPEKRPPAGLPSGLSADDKRIMKESLNPQRLHFPHAAKLRKWLSEYQANFKSPAVNFEYVDGSWRQRHPGHISTSKSLENINRSAAVGVAGSPDDAAISFSSAISERKRLHDLEQQQQQTNVTPVQGGDTADDSIQNKDGVLVEGDRSNLNLLAEGGGVSWYNEVLELRKKADEYRKRSLGTHFSRDHLLQIFAQQAELWDNESVSTTTTSSVPTSSLSALSLEHHHPSSGARQQQTDTAQDQTTAAATRPIRPISRYHEGEETKDPTNEISPPSNQPSRPDHVSTADRSSDRSAGRSPQVPIVRAAREYAVNHSPSDRQQQLRSSNITDISQQQQQQQLRQQEEEETMGRQELQIRVDDGRVATPELHQQTPITKIHRRHHLDRTTPAVGGTLLVSPGARSTNTFNIDEGSVASTTSSPHQAAVSNTSHGAVVAGVKSRVMPPGSSPSTYSPGQPIHDQYSRVGGAKSDAWTQSPLQATYSKQARGEGDVAMVTDRRTQRSHYDHQTRHNHHHHAKGHGVIHDSHTTRSVPVNGHGHDYRRDGDELEVGDSSTDTVKSEDLHHHHHPQYTPPLQQQEQQQQERRQERQQQQLQSPHRHHHHKPNVAEWVKKQSLPERGISVADEHERNSHRHYISDRDAIGSSTSAVGGRPSSDHLASTRRVISGDVGGRMVNFSAAPVAEEVTNPSSSTNLRHPIHHYQRDSFSTSGAANREGVVDATSSPAPAAAAIRPGQRPPPPYSAWHDLSSSSRIQDQQLEQQSTERRQKANKATSTNYPHRQHTSTGHHESSRHVAHNGGSGVPENDDTGLDLIDIEGDDMVEDDRGSLSNTSTCSFASEVLDRARRHRDAFWGGGSSRGAKRK